MSGVKLKDQHNYTRIIYALVVSSLASVLLFFIDVSDAHSWYYWFLIWNLGLAYIAPLIAWWLTFRLRTTPWLSWRNVLLTFLWFIFMPNSFYMITDLIHTGDLVTTDLLYNVVMIISFVFNALIAGYAGLYLIHWALLKRFYYRWVHVIIAAILLICSFAIYMGRYLRWSSWDVVSNPFGVLFDFSDTITNPSSHPEFVQTTAIFFILLGSMYFVIWQCCKVLRKEE
jgi:uncharacterized membrane protein